MPAKSAAQTLLEKADKKANSSGGWFSSSETKFEEAGDLYKQAANAFTIDKEFKQAGDAFAREAECREKSGEKADAGLAWWNASKAYKRDFPDLAISALSQTVRRYTEDGRFRQAADREKEIGQMYLDMAAESNDASNLKDKAIASFIQAADWYKHDGADATAKTWYLKAADIYAEQGKYRDAIGHYEGVAKEALKSDLTKYSVKEYYLKICLCYLAQGDWPLANSKRMEYFPEAPGRSGTREGNFIKGLIEAAQAAVGEIDENPIQIFGATVTEFDQVSTRMNDWQVAMLLKIKRWIEENMGKENLL